MLLPVCQCALSMIYKCRVDALEVQMCVDVSGTLPMWAMMLKLRMFSAGNAVKSIDLLGLAPFSFYMAGLSALLDSRVLFSLFTSVELFEFHLL